MKRVKTEFSAIGLLVVVWLFAATGAYFVSHKPLGANAAVLLVQAAGQFGAALAIVSVAGGLGRRLLPGLALRPAARLAVQAALGLGCFAILILVTGSVVGVARAGGWALLIGSGILLRREILRWWRDGRDVANLWGSGGLAARWVGAGVVFLLLATLAIALLPPIKFDALVYHLALPEAYLAGGRVSVLTGNIFSGMPQAAEMLYMWALALAGAEAAAALGWLVGALTVVGLGGWVAQWAGARAGVVAAALLVSGATLASSLSWAYADWLAALFGLGALVMCSGEHRNAVVAGIFAGLALGTKYSAGVVLLAGLGAILFRGGVRWQERLRDGFNFGGAAVLTALPWLVKNAIWTGNPFYPFLLPTQSMSALRLALYQNQPAWGGWENVWLLPWQAATSGLEGAPGFGASIGPLLLAFGALAWLGWRTRPADERTAIRSVAIFSVAGIVVWAVAGRVSGLLIQTRLYLALFPGFAALAAAGFRGLERFRWEGVRLGRIAMLLLMGVMALNIFQLSADALRKGVPQTLFGLQTQSDYLNKNLGMYQLALAAVAELPADADVLFLWEARSFACARACEPDEILDRWVTDARAVGYVPADILAAWRQAGHTHVLYYRAGADLFRGDPRLLPEDWRALEETLALLPPITDLNQIYTLYALP